MKDMTIHYSSNMVSDTADTYYWPHMSHLDMLIHIWLHTDSWWVDRSDKCWLYGRSDSRHKIGKTVWCMMDMFHLDIFLLRYRNHWTWRGSSRLGIVTHLHMFDMVVYTRCIAFIACSRFLDRILDISMMLKKEHIRQNITDRNQLTRCMIYSQLHIVRIGE